MKVFNIFMIKDKNQLKIMNEYNQVNLCKTRHLEFMWSSVIIHNQNNLRDSNKNSSTNIILLVIVEDRIRLLKGTTDK